MYSVLLAEDEILERENTRESWIWDTGEFELCYDAANGREAWARLQSSPADILITDIKMPFMDGIALSRLVRENMPNVKIIILSGYSDFAYAQQALSLGVSEYIVKPIKSAELLEAMRRAAAQIEQERMKQADMEKLRAQVNDNRPLMVHKLLDDIVLGIYPETDLKERARALGVNIEAAYYIGIVLRYIDKKLLYSEDDHLLALDVQKIVDEMAVEQRLAFHKDLNEIYILMMGDSEETLAQNARRFIQSLKREIQKNVPRCCPVFAAGNIAGSLSAIPESYANASLLLNLPYFGRDVVFLDKTLLEEISKRHEDRLSLVTEKSMIENLIKFGSILEVKPVVGKLIDKMKSMHLNHVLYQYTCVELINLFRAFLDSLGEDGENMPGIEFDGLFQLENWLKWSSDIDTFGAYLINIINRIFDIRDRKKNYKFLNVISVAKKHIDESFSDPGLNLNTIASMTGISSSYLSTLFNQEMGESFIEYLTRKRIEKAKEMLKSTSMRATDIAFEVGYQDSNYFSKIFKKITGQTPREFRS